jgi:DNA-binding transcriptional ArsR family regulator
MLAERKLTGRAGPEQKFRELADVDRLIHEPARLAVLAVLRSVDEADFLFILRQTGLTKGNLTIHLSKLEAAGYVAVEKTYRGKVPRTVCRLTEVGRRAFERYRERVRRGIGG